MKKKLPALFLICVLGALALAGGALAAKPRLPKTLKMVMGFAGDIELNQYNASLPDDYTISIKPQSVARLELNRDEGYVYIVPQKTGKATVTLKWGKNKAVCKLRVHANVYTRKKPAKGSGKAVVLSVKRMRYVGSDLVAELYVYNRTGKALRGLAGLSAQMMLLDANGHMQGPAGPALQLPDWTPKGGKLKNGKTAVMTVRFEGMLERDGYQYMLKYPEVEPRVTFEIVR